MSLYFNANQTCEGSNFEYCNYGYDESIYSSFEDCLSRRNSNCSAPSSSKSKLDKDKEIISILIISVMILFVISTVAVLKWS